MFSLEAELAALARRASEQPEGASARTGALARDVRITIAAYALVHALRGLRSHFPKLLIVISLVAAATTRVPGRRHGPAASKGGCSVGLELHSSATGSSAWLSRQLGPSRPPHMPPPNPSLNLTRYGMQRKPGVCRFHYGHTPGLHCMPSRAG